MSNTRTNAKGKTNRSTVLPIRLEDITKQLLKLVSAKRKNNSLRFHTMTDIITVAVEEYALQNYPEIYNSLYQQTHIESFTANNAKNLSLKGLQVLESYCAADYEKVYSLPNGGKVAITKVDVDFFEKLQKLPASTKIEMMQLSLDEMDSYIKKQKTQAIKEVEKIFYNTWFYRSTGEIAVLDDEYINLDWFGLELKPDAILKGLKSGKIPLSYCEQIKEAIESECYLPDEN